MQLIPAMAAMVDVMVVDSVVASACAILPTFLCSALLEFCILRWGGLLDRGGVVAEYPPWHIPHPPPP
jgi:hypothetical protein